MSSIQINLDGREFISHEVQASVLVQPGEEFPITSPIVVHIAISEPAVYEEYWRTFIEAGDDGVVFKKLTFRSVKHGADTVVTEVLNPVLKNAGREQGFLTFFADSYSLLENDPNNH